MRKLECKLKEIRNRTRREALLASVDAPLQQALSCSEYSHDASSIKHAAFDTWDVKRGCQTTTRGDISTWRRQEFATKQEVLSALRQYSYPTNTSGWLFFDADGPYYKVSATQFRSHLDSIWAYLGARGTIDFGWVGAERDCGVIVEEDHPASHESEFLLCRWGFDS